VRSVDALRLIQVDHIGREEGDPRRRFEVDHLDPDLVPAPASDVVDGKTAALAAEPLVDLHLGRRQKAESPSLGAPPKREIDEAFGGWTKAQKDHFDDGAIYDQILAAIKK